MRKPLKAFAGVLSLIIWTFGAWTWQTFISGTATGDDETIDVMAVEGRGHVVTAGIRIPQDATGMSLTVITLNRTDGGAFRTALSVTPTVVNAGESITVTWRDINAPMPTDWIGLYLPGTANTNFLNWMYVSCTKTPDGSQQQKSCDFVVPALLAPGTYELRLLAQDSFMRLATSNAFTVRERRER